MAYFKQKNRGGLRDFIGSGDVRMLSSTRSTSAIKMASLFVISAMVSGTVLAVEAINPAVSAYKILTMEPDQHDMFGHPNARIIGSVETEILNSYLLANEIRSFRGRRDPVQASLDASQAFSLARTEEGFKDDDRFGTVPPNLIPILARAADAVEDAPGSIYFLLAKASKESRFDTEARARTSSATGLFQFTDVSWLRSIKHFGPRHGLEDFSNDIRILNDGRVAVSSWARRQQILKLRNDPYIQSVMTLELLKSDAEIMQKTLGKDNLRPWEMYVTHLLGSGSARRLFKAIETDPDIEITDVLPAPVVRANKSLFFRDSDPVTVREFAASIRSDINTRIEYFERQIGYLVQRSELDAIQEVPVRM